MLADECRRLERRLGRDLRGEKARLLWVLWLALRSKQAARLRGLGRLRKQTLAEVSLLLLRLLLGEKASRLTCGLRERSCEAGLTERVEASNGLRLRLLRPEKSLTRLGLLWHAENPRLLTNDGWVLQVALLRLL